MITVISYIALRSLLGVEWSGWLLVLPVITDVVLIEWVGRK